MGALRGSLTFSRFYVIGELSDDFQKVVEKRIQKHAIVPLVPEEDEVQHHGWACHTDPFDTELDYDKIFLGEYVALALRVDRWAIPGPLLKAHLKEAEQKLLEQKGLERLGRKTKAELKDMVVKKLRKRLVPVTKSYDLIWNRTTGVVLFFSHSEKIHELAQEMFEKTFGVQLLLESPGTLADKSVLSRAEQQAFADLEPTLLGGTGT